MSEPTVQSVSAAGSAPPAAPREMTAGARRAVWGQPVVRGWGVAAGVLLVAMAGLLVSQVLEWRREVRLVKEGVAVEAEVFEAGNPLRNKLIPALANVDLNYEYGGKAYKVTGALAERKGALMSATMIPIRIDPENPKVWTDRTEPPGFGAKLMGPLLVLPAVLVAGVMAWWQRRRVARVWVHGEAQQAVVVETRQAALAPLSQAVRCALASGKDKRLILVYVPLKLGKVKKGDVIWLVTQVGNPQRAVAAGAFEGR